MSEPPPLKPLHPDTSLSQAKLTSFGQWTTEKLIQSLAPGEQHCLKTKADGTMLDGHHRVHILRARDVDVDLLPREA